MKNKAISNILASILLIVITITLAITIFSFSKSMIEDFQMSPPNCRKLKRDIEIDYINWDQRKNELKIQLAKLTNENITKIDFILVGEGGEERWSCSQDCRRCRPQNSLEKEYIISAGQKPQKVKVRVDSCLIGNKKFT